MYLAQWQIGTYSFFASTLYEVDSVALSTSDGNTVSCELQVKAGQGMGYTWQVWLYILLFPACWPVYAIAISAIIRSIRGDTLPR